MRYLGTRWLAGPAGVVLIVSLLAGTQTTVAVETALVEAMYRAPSPSEVAARAYARMTPRQRVGQLFMMAVPSTGASAADLRDLRATRTGNAYLSGNSTEGRSGVSTIVSRLRDVLTQARVRPFVGVDQEGGLVQHLRGPGFSRMPTALAQGRMKRAELRRAAHHWGKQLRAAGLNLNLAPVADTVPASIGTSNEPIGQYKREYGHTVRRVRRHATAFAQGMNNAHVQTAVKHFPGLGRATANTDDTRRVTDPTRPRDPYLRPYRAVIDAGSRFAMISSAIYPHIDPHRRACFSKTVIEGLLRGDADFSGIVVSDSLGAESVSFIPPRKRAIRFFDAGGTMVLDSALNHLPAMTKAVLSRIDRDPAFAAIIRQNILRVLTVKAKAGLVG